VQRKISSTKRLRNDGIIQVAVFWVVTPCIDMVGYQRFVEPCCLHLNLSNAYKILVGKLKGRGNLVELGVDVGIILEWILGKYGGKVLTGFI